MDAPQVVPFWGAKTSYLNFCEEDYVITRFIAEFINTLSSLVFAGYGLFGLWHLRGKAQAVSRSVPYFGLIGIGFCSAGYHMTLKYHTQMSDEFSMHLLTTPIVYRILTYKKDAVYTRRMGIILSLLFTLVIGTHMIMDEFLLHATSFGLSVLTLVVGASRIIATSTDPRAKETLRNLVIFGLSSFVFGYFVWLIDSFACWVLTDMRQSVGLPLAFLLELHGWWHVFTAIGGYSAVVIIDSLTSAEVPIEPAGPLAWPLQFAIRYMQSAKTPSKQA